MTAGRYALAVIIRWVTATTASESSVPPKISTKTIVTAATVKLRLLRGAFRQRSSMWRWAPMQPPR
jgi:hypothetical protein